MKRSSLSTTRGRFAAGAAVAFLTILLAAQAIAAGPAMMAGFPLRAGANVMLMWMPFPGATAYSVYRGEAAGGPYQKIADSPMNMFTDMNVPTDKSFYYVVKAVVGGKEGDPSPEAVMKGLEPMVTPKFIGNLMTPDNKLSLRWEGNPKAAFYNLYRATEEKGEYKLLSSVQDTKYTDGAVEVGKSYFYKVTAVSSANVESPKADQPLAVKVEKREEAAAIITEATPINVKQLGTYDVEGDVILRTPRGLAVLPDGGVVVVDGRNFLHHVSPEQTLVKLFAQPPADFKGDWGFLTNVSFDPKAKELYACFSSANAIRVFDLEGKLLRTLSIGKPDPKVAPNQAFAPTPTAAAMGADGVLWVVDAGFYQLVGVDPKTGKELKRYAGLGRFHPDRSKADDKSLETPSDIAINPKTGELFVLETGPQRITVLSKTADFLRRFGGRGALPGKFQLPSSIALGDDGTVWVGDRTNANIQAFTPEGKYKGSLTLPKKQDPRDKLMTGIGLTGLGVRGKQVFYSDTIKERLVVYEFLPQ